MTQGVQHRVAPTALETEGCSGNPNAFSNDLAERLIQIFNGCFKNAYNTVLVRGEGEPLYQPGITRDTVHKILFAHGYASSALHEVAHWCIAGARRRRLTDYGYWYQPDGRNGSQQQLFLKVEVKPQALEWIFSVACNHRFQFSMDNLLGESGDCHAFPEQVLQQVHRYINGTMPKRARHFLDALSAEFGTSVTLQNRHFSHPK